MALRVQLGAMNRPWTEFTFDEALSGIAGAGFTHFGFLAQQKKQLVAAETSPEEAAAAVADVRRHKLEPAFNYSSISATATEDEGVSYIQRLIDHGQRLGIPVLLEMGAKPENAERYFAIMRRAAPYAAEHGVTIAIKPHGGLTTTGDECLRAVETVNHPGFRLCFDPGNLMYYAGERPEAELPKLAPYVVAMCVKDETGGNGPARSVSVTPGDGEVDFRAVFRILKDSGFEGRPAVVETLAGKTLDEVNQEAKRAHTFLTDVLASV
jgi:sugar phosphate isomerase/epimerase